MANANDSAHVPPKARHVLMEFAKALWYLRIQLAFLFVLYLLLSVIMYFVGGPVESGNGAPSSFGQTLYFCAMRALTIGYRDMMPTTTVGRIDSALLGVLGILMVGLVAAAAVRGVQEAVRHAGTRR
ncbi:voltage-gated potassium channel [Paraburkholderia sp. BL8N3]|nr:potassium channel family protein [Paraburkholderia sp. BL8N3]TCK32787.1 voltage-gated potassium channel [Paraburkholderia sp. BL8N3]